METLVVPLRAGLTDLAQRYETLLTRSQGLQLIAIDDALLRSAAHLRAQARLKTPDALQMASALSARCPTFVTNDRNLPSLPGLRVLQAKSYLPPA